MASRLVVSPHTSGIGSPHFLHILCRPARTPLWDGVPSLVSTKIRNHCDLVLVFGKRNFELDKNGQNLKINKNACSMRNVYSNSKYSTGPKLAGPICLTVPCFVPSSPGQLVPGRRGAPEVRIGGGGDPSSDLHLTLLHCFYRLVLNLSLSSFHPSIWIARSPCCFAYITPISSFNGFIHIIFLNRSFFS